MGEYFDDAIAKRALKQQEMESLNQNSGFKKRRLDDGSEMILMEFRYNRHVL